jgi:hypothetical protein
MKENHKQSDNPIFIRPRSNINLRGIRAPYKVVSRSPSVSNRASVAAVGVENNTVGAGGACLHESEQVSI